jgi:hypothetical protein
MTTPSGGLPAPSRPGATVEDQLRVIEAMTDVRLRDLDVADLLIALLDRVAALMSVDTVAVLLLDPASQQLVARAAWGFEEEVRHGSGALMIGHGPSASHRTTQTQDTIVANRAFSSRSIVELRSLCHQSVSRSRSDGRRPIICEQPYRSVGAVQRS